MNKQHLQDSTQAQNISHVLTRSCEQLNQDIVLRLHKARNAALQTKVVQRRTVLTLNTGHFTHLLPHTGTQWLFACTLLALLVTGVGGYWQHSSEQELSHVDLSILTDELPLEVFVDD